MPSAISTPTTTANRKPRIIGWIVKTDAVTKLFQFRATFMRITEGAGNMYSGTRKLRFALLGHRVLQASRLPDLVQPVLDALAAETRELVRATIATEDRLVWLACAQGAPPGLVYQPAMDGPVLLHATANGKAYLATL